MWIKSRNVIKPIFEFVDVRMILMVFLYHFSYCLTWRRWSDISNKEIFKRLRVLVRRCDALQFGNWIYEHENQYHCIPASLGRSSVVFDAEHFNRCSISKCCHCGMASSGKSMPSHFTSQTFILAKCYISGSYSILCLWFSYETPSINVYAMWCVANFVWRMCKKCIRYPALHVFIRFSRTVCDLIIQETFHGATVTKEQLLNHMGNVKWIWNQQLSFGYSYKFENISVILAPKKCRFSLVTHLCSAI